MVLMASLLSRPIPEIAHSLIAKPWFIEPQAFRLLLATQFGSDTESAKAGPGDPQPRNNARRGRSAVVPIRGIVTAHPIPFFESIGWTISGVSVVRMVTDALEDPETDSVVLDIDSPGGEVAGSIESAMTLESIRANASKPIVAVSNYLCASAAYWIACSAAHEIVASPSSITGSIGVVAAHEDASGFYEQVGVKVEFITAGEFKAEGNDAEPLSNEGRAHIQSQVDYFYGLFTQAVADSRGASQADVENGYGRGRVLTAKAALQSNLVDRIEPIGATILRLASPQARAAIKRKAWLLSLTPKVESYRLKQSRQAWLL